MSKFIVKLIWSEKRKSDWNDDIPICLDVDGEMDIDSIKSMIQWQMDTYGSIDIGAILFGISMPMYKDEDHVEIYTLDDWFDKHSIMMTLA